MVLAGEPLAVLDLHHLPGPWMERIEDPHLERQTPGIVTLVRLALARVISLPPSASPWSKTDGGCCSRAPAISSGACKSHAANSPLKARSPSSTSITC